MKYDDLEKTRDLFDIMNDDVPSPINDIDSEGISKDSVIDDFTFGLSGDDAVEPQKEDIETVTNKREESLKNNKKKKDKKSLKEKWKGLSKKKKIIIIVSSILIILIIIAIILFFVLRKEEEKPKEEKPEVIVEKDNYIYQDGVLIFLDKNDKEIGTYECVNKSEDLCYVSTYSNEDNFDGEKNVYEDESLIERPSAIYQNNYVFVYDNENDEEENIILYNIDKKDSEGTYTLVKGFNDSDFVILKDKNNKYGAIDFSSGEVKEVLEFSYDYLGRLNSKSNIVVKTNDRYYIYNAEGKNLSEGLRYEVKSYNDKYVVVNNNGYYVYSYDGNLIFDDAYNYIELLDDYVVLIDKDSLFIRDYQNNKYNEVGVELDNSYYNPLNIYDEDKNYLETKQAYKISINEDMMDVTYTKDNKERTQTIDLQEGKISAKYNYISYFDSMLYFYKDEEKSDLLGTYKCSNVNSTDLTNCTIATESFYSKNEKEEDKSNNVGWIPIYNNRYAFILDTIDLNNPTIILYDLKDNKTLAKYKSVDSGTYSGKKEVTFIDTNASYIMAQNKSNSEYGLIRISDNVSGTIAFDYSSIEKIGDYYEVGTSTGTYQLFSNVGVEVTKTYGYKIVNYVGTYLKVQNNKDYYVYDFDGNKLREKDGAYKHVDLQNNYYVVIDSTNKLNIHKYSDENFALSESLDIGTDNYVGAYTVTEANGGFVVTIKSTNTTYTFDSNGLKSVSS